MKQWKRYNQDTWALQHNGHIACTTLVRSKYLSYWRAQIKLSGDTEVKDYGRYISAAKAIKNVEKILGGDHE